jgi:hypothetical protein
MNWHGIYVFLAWTSVIILILETAGLAALENDDPKRKAKKSEEITFNVLFATFIVAGALAAGTS